MEEKMFKPKSCAECPAVKYDKKTLICGVQPTAVKNKCKDYKPQDWYKICPIGWDK